MNTLYENRPKRVYYNRETRSIYLATAQSSRAWLKSQGCEGPRRAKAWILPWFNNARRYFVGMEPVRRRMWAMLAGLGKVATGKQVEKEYLRSRCPVCKAFLLSPDAEKAHEEDTGHAPRCL